MKQIPESAQIVVAIADIFRRRSVGLLGAPIGPLAWNERPAAVWQNHENQDDAAPPDFAAARLRNDAEQIGLLAKEYGPLFHHGFRTGSCSGQ